MREVNMLQRRDKDHGRIAFVDIASPDYQPAQNAGISFEEVNAPTFYAQTTLHFAVQFQQRTAFNAAILADHVHSGHGRNPCCASFWRGRQEH